MSDLVFGPQVVEWVAQRIRDFGPTANCQGIGFARDGRLQAGAAYIDYRGHDIRLAFAADDPAWATKGNIRAVFAYPFLQLGCVRVTALTAKANKRARKLLEGVGFKQEGVHPRAIDGKQTGISYGMLRDDCKWLGN